jgi:restriction endonuclease S subunit
MSAVESNDVWLGKMPSDWQRSRLRNVAALSPGYSATVPASDEQCTVVPMELLSGDGAIDVTNQQPLDEVTSGLTLFEEGDVLFAKITPCMENGKGAFVRELPTRYAFGSTEFHVLRPSKKIDGPFLYYATFNPIYRAYAAENMVGAAGQKRVSSRFVKDTRLFLPPLLEQQCIAAYLDTSCAAIDAAVAAKRRQLETLDALRKETVTRAITRGLKLSTRTKPSGEDWLGEIPAHWSAPCLKRLLSEPLTYGLNEAAELEERDLPRYLRITDFDDDGNLREDTFRSLPREIAREALLEPNDVLFARSGATVGKTFIFRNYDGEACFAGYLIRARTQLWKLDPLFLYLFTKSTAYDSWKNLIFTRATIQNISAAKYNYLAIPLPPLDEQHAIVAHVEEKSAEFRSLTVTIESQIATLTAYRKSLIHECVTGQRRVTEGDLRRAGRAGSIRPVEDRP